MGSVWRARKWCHSDPLGWYQTDIRLSIPSQQTRTEILLDCHCRNCVTLWNPSEIKTPASLPSVWLVENCALVFLLKAPMYILGGPFIQSPVHLNSAETKCYLYWICKSRRQFSEYIFSFTWNVCIFFLTEKGTLKLSGAIQFSVTLPFTILSHSLFFNRVVDSLSLLI